MPLTIKLTLWFLVLPVFLLVSFFGFGFDFYRNSFDATSFFTAISGFFSSIVITFLVWERLSDSLSQKLDYLNKNFLSKLYSNFNRDILGLFSKQDDTEKLSKDLKRYGKFITLSLCPNSLLMEIEKYLSLHKKFYSRWEKIDEIARKNFPSSASYVYGQWDFAQFIGFDIQFRGNIPNELKTQYETAKQAILKEYPELIPNAIIFFKETKKLNETVFDQLKDFLVSNNLGLLPEPSPLLQ